MSSAHLNFANLSPQIQAILPVLENLQTADYDFLMNFLKNKTANNQQEKAVNQPSLSREEIAKKRFNRFPNAMVMSDDFDDYLGDDFWFPEDDILYKYK